MGANKRKGMGGAKKKKNTNKNSAKKYKKSPEASQSQQPLYQQQIDRANVVRNDPNGNCFFNALSQAAYGDQERQADLRRLICFFEEQNEGNFQQFQMGAQDNVHWARPMAEHIANMRNNHICATDYEMISLVNNIDITLVLWTINYQTQQLQQMVRVNDQLDPSLQNRNTEIHMLFRYQGSLGHYELLRNHPLTGDELDFPNEQWQRMFDEQFEIMNAVHQGQANEEGQAQGMSSKRQFDSSPQSSQRFKYDQPQSNSQSSSPRRQKSQDVQERNTYRWFTPSYQQPVGYDEIFQQLGDLKKFIPAKYRQGCESKDYETKHKAKQNYYAWKSRELKTFYRQVLKEDRKDVEVLRWIVNKDEHYIIPDDHLFNTIIREAHELKAGIHRSIIDTVRELKKQGYCWKNINKDVTNFQHQCLQCNKRKMPNKNQKQYKPILTNQQRDRYVADIVMLPAFLSSKHAIQLLNVVDHFSKFAWSFPLLNKTAQDIDRCLRTIFLYSGVPRVLGTDNGKEFVNATVERTLQEFNIQHARPRVGNPKPQGAVEAFHKFMLSMLRDQYEKQKEGFRLEVAVQDALLYYNGKIHTTTKFTPSQIFFDNNNAHTEAVRTNMFNMNKNKMKSLLFKQGQKVLIHNSVIRVSSDGTFVYDFKQKLSSKDKKLQAAYDIQGEITAVYFDSATVRITDIGSCKLKIQVDEEYLIPLDYIKLFGN